MVKKEIRLGISQLSFSIPLFIAKELNLFEKENLNVKFYSDYSDAQTLCKDIFQGKLDCGGEIALPIILDFETKTPGTIQFSNIAVETKEKAFTYLITKIDSKIEKISDLKNKKIGIFPTTAFRLWLNIILKKNNINPKRVNIIEIPTTRQKESLESGAIDVLFTNDPTATSILNYGFAKKISDLSLLNTFILKNSSSFPIGGFVFRKDFIKENFQEAEKIVKIIDSAIRFIENNPMKAKEFCKKHISKEFEKNIDKINLLSFWTEKQVVKKDLQEVVDIYYYNGLFDKPINSRLILFEPSYRLILNNLKKDRIQDDKTIKILKSINLEAKKGEFITFFGPNGCGKTTILNIISGLVRADSGKVSINDKEIESHTIGYVYQDYRKILMPWKKIIDNIGFALKLKGLSKEIRDKEVRDLCQLLDIKIDLDSYTYQLSGGQQQLVAILSAIIDKPEILLLDEPFSAIDFQKTTLLQEKIIEIWQKLGLTIIFISHDIEETIFLANKICLLTNRPSQIKNVYENPMPYPRTLKDKEQKIFIDLKNNLLIDFSKEVKLE